MIERIGAFFAAPGRQAIGWAALGIIGVALAGGGLLLFSGGGDGDGGTVPANNGSVTPSLSASAITSPSASATRIGLTATGFTPVHTVGDLLVVSHFTNGGTTSTIERRAPCTVRLTVKRPVRAANEPV